jgi:hypothetical protein
MDDEVRKVDGAWNYRGANGRRHDVEFDNAGITVEIFFGDEIVEIIIASRFGQAVLCAAERAA